MWRTFTAQCNYQLRTEYRVNLRPAREDMPNPQDSQSFARLDAFGIQNTQIQAVICELNLIITSRPASEIFLDPSHYYI